MCLGSAEKGGDGEREAHFVDYWKYERFEMGNYWLAVVFGTGFLVISGKHSRTVAIYTPHRSIYVLFTHSG